MSQRESTKTAPRNTSDAAAFHAAVDPLAFAIEALQARALRIVELETEVKQLKAKLARRRHPDSALP